MPPVPDAAAGAAPPSTLDVDRARTRRLAQAIAEQHLRQQPARPQEPSPAGGPPPAAPARSVDTALNGATAARTAPPAPAVRGEPAPTARRYILTPAGRPGVAGPPKPPGTFAVPGAAVQGDLATPPATAAPRAVADHPARAMRDELEAIKSMVGQVLQRQSHPTPAPSGDMPQQLFDMYLTLIGQDLSEELANQVVDDIRRELTPAQLRDAGAVREAMLAHLADFIPTADEPLSLGRRDGRPCTVALIGPTGVGKTTTIAKLAATLKLRRGKAVGLVTADTYRIAAVEQLRTYASIIDVPLEVALTPEDMREALGRLESCDVVLVDTAGRSQHDRDRIEELRRFVLAARPHEVHLVLSGAAGQRVLLREAEAFASVGIDRIVLTKLDEAVSFGMLVNVLRTVGKALSFVTTGQEVPDDLESGRPRRLAELVLGGEVSI
jgi:flagellar biosynthesis protein FlhF